MRIERILLLGGYGNYGAVIAEHLSDIPEITLVIAGRNKAKVVAFANRFARAEGIELNSRDPHLLDHFNELNLDLIVFTAGPFQNQDYRVARAAIDAGIHYIDMADGRDFVCNMAEQLDKEAKRADLFIATGVSSVPSLTSSVVDHFLPQFSQLRAVDYGISTSEKMPGQSTVASMLTYCGRPIKQLKEGRWITRYGWQDTHFHQFSAPIGKRYMGACDIPDIALFPNYYPALESATFSAGTKSLITHFGTWLLSWLIRWRFIDQPDRFAHLLHRCGTFFERFYHGYSAIYLHLKGEDLEGESKEMEWELIAANNEGALIPSMAIVALVKKLLNEKTPRSGVHDACGLLTYEEYCAVFRAMNITIKCKNIY